MSTKAIIVCVVGAAASSVSAQERPVLQSAEFSGQTFHAVRATAITGLTADGQFIYGETIELGQNHARFNGAITAYDSALMADTNSSSGDYDPVCADLAPHDPSNQPSSRYWFGLEFSFQSFAEDVIPAAGTEGGIIDEIVMAGSRPLCDSGTGTTSEVLQMVVTSWDNIDNFPDLDGSDGWAYSNGSGFVSPFELDANDNYVGFNGGVILTYADTANGNEMFSFGDLGYAILIATDLEGLGVPMPTGTDYDNDGDSDGGIMVQWTRGDGGNGLGNMLGGFYPSTRAQSMLWGTTAMEQPGTTCPYPNAIYPGFGLGNSDGIVWGEGEDLCNTPAVDPDWSTGGPLGDATIDERYDPNFDVADWFGIVPDFVELGLMVRLRVAGGTPPRDCCDINDDGVCNPADFSAWINAFNNQLPECDVNQSGTCDPTDFSAWISAFNDSNANNPQQCVF